MSGYYRVEVRRANPLSPEAEAALFQQYRKRRTAKRLDTIVRQYLYWAAELACRYCGPRMPREDAIGAANLGLMRAIEDFDPSRNRRFVTHSYFHIRRAVLSALRDTYVVNPATGINVVRHQFNLSEKTPEDLRRFAAAKRAVYDATGHPNATDRLELNLPDGAATDHRLQPSDDGNEVRDSVEDFSMLELLRDRIGELGQPERTILTLRYLAPDTPLFREIGRRLKLTEDRVRYLHNRALAKLRAGLKKEI